MVDGDVRTLPWSHMPTWRRIQIHPPMQLAVFRALLIALRRAQNDRDGIFGQENRQQKDETGQDVNADKNVQTQQNAKELSLILPKCRRLVEAETFLASSYPTPVAINDHALRACDHCGRELFNRFLRIAAPLQGVSEHVGVDDVIHNPGRDVQRRPNEPGDFCFCTSLSLSCLRTLLLRCPA